MPRICDYEGSGYRADFWESQNRAYEDGVERVAISKLLPRTGKRIIEIGAGFGRLADLYMGYEQVVLLDYARTQLEEAQRYLGENAHIIYVVADVYNLPFRDNLFDTLTMIRVMHHLTAVKSALTELYRIIRPNGVSLIEYANKRNLKSIPRWLLRGQPWSPFDQEPIEFVELNFNFHPHWMHQQMAEVGFEITNLRAISNYRVGFLKQRVSANLLVKLDSWTQPVGQYCQFSPSIMMKAQAIKPANTAISSQFFQCPHCHNSHLYLSTVPDIEGQLFICSTCQSGWSFRNGIYDFKNRIDLG